MLVVWRISLFNTLDLEIQEDYTMINAFQLQSVSLKLSIKNSIWFQFLDHDTDLSHELPRSFVHKLPNDEEVPINVPKVIIATSAIQI